jgi:hypothetical protein
MTNLTILAAGGASAYADCGFTLTDFNSMPNGNCVVAATEVSNATNLDPYGEISFSFFNGATTTTAASRFDLYWLPENQDATTYGDNPSTGSTLPGSSYRVATAMIRAGITSGQAIVGTFKPFEMTRGDGKFAIANRTGGALNAAAGAAVKYRGTRINTNG